jgi:hypothetical protein
MYQQLVARTCDDDEIWAMAAEGIDDTGRRRVLHVNHGSVDGFGRCQSVDQIV